MTYKGQITGSGYDDFLTALDDLRIKKGDIVIVGKNKYKYDVDTHEGRPNKILVDGSATDHELYTILKERQKWKTVF